MRNILLIAVLVGGCLGDDITVSDACNQQTCMELGTMTLEFFGDGRDGDFLPLAGSVITLTRDMYWRDLIFSPGAHPGAPTRIDPNGFRIFVSRTMRGPGLDAFGNIQAFISRDGNSGAANVGGAAYPFAGTLTGGSAAGTTGVIPNGSGAPNFPNPGGLGVWPAQLHPGIGGNGGNGEFTTGGTAVGATIASDSAGSLDLLSAIQMRFLDGTPISGGAGGASGGGASTGLADFPGGGGGGGGGNIVVVARQIENASTILVSSQGGSGADGYVPGVGGGGGGGGGYITMVVQRLPFPVMSVSGGNEGSYIASASPGTQGGDGVILPFCFTITP